MPGPVFLRGKLVDLCLRRESTDFERCWKWVNDPDCRQFLLIRHPVTESEEREFFQQKPDAIHLTIVTKKGIYIGNIGMHRISPENGTAETGTLIGDKRYWGKGYGTDAKMILLRYAFDELGLVKVISHVLETNPRSLAYAKKCGYAEESTSPSQVMKNGKRLAVVQLAVYRDSFEKAWERYSKGKKRTR